jgi:hypothetical protein
MEYDRETLFKQWNHIYEVRYPQQFKIWYDAWEFEQIVLLGRAIDEPT